MEFKRQKNASFDPFKEAIFILMQLNSISNQPVQTRGDFMVICRLKHRRYDSNLYFDRIDLWAIFLRRSYQKPISKNN